ncbi:molybdenum cofactor biosynthesis protein MoaE [Kineococcus sp. LSe6-4]|uniref:Molybdenum cofactor biosynthesis protein MoaE n=1 Tax=Kineococcus halophytocola TaxID=3234027 RepID=A0ABV4H2Z3_9ACTN
MVRTTVGPEPLDVAEHAALVGDRAAGAVVTFAGVVRDHDHGRSVRALEYQGHPSAPGVLRDVVAEVVAGSEVDAVAVGHRVGPLAVGDVAFAVAVSAAHRAEAFAACARLVDEVKDRLPVWKHQHFADGTSEWVACP